MSNVPFTCGCKGTGHDWNCPEGHKSISFAPNVPVVGWMCPVCKGGLSPYIDRCPCVPTSNAYVIIGATSTEGLSP